MALLCLSIAWIIGIFLGSIFNLPLWTIALGALPLLLIPVLFRHKKTLLLSSFALIILLGGAVYSHYIWYRVDSSDVRLYNDGDKVTIEGMIINEPEKKSSISTFNLEARKIEVNSTEHEASGKISITTIRYREYHYGDMLRVKGKLETPQQFGNFDYQNYLAVDDIYSVMNYPQISLVSTGNGFKPLSWIYSLRNIFAQKIDMALPEPHIAVAKGLLLGITTGISGSLRNMFTVTGTSHILAISGMQLTIIMGLMVSFGSRIFGRQHNIHIWLALAMVWFYAVLTGAQPPIIRSAIMGTIFLTAELLGRQKNIIPALTLAAAIMVGIQPKVIADVSFQLSYLSMCGLVLIYPLFQRALKLRVSPAENPGFMRRTYVTMADAFAVTLGAIIAIWPLTVHYFNIVSLFGLPANVFMLPTMPAIIGITAVMCIAGLFAPFLAQVIGWLNWLIISYFLLIVQIFYALPFSSVQLRINQSWFVWVYYAILVLILLIVHNREQTVNLLKTISIKASALFNNAAGLILKFPAKWGIGVLAIAVILMWASVFSLPDTRLHVSFLNVGQGDAILIQTPNRQKILIDGGPNPERLKEELSKKLAFWDRKIDMVILTQPQSDHIMAIPDLLKNYHVDSIIQTGNLGDTLLYTQLLSVIKQKQTPLNDVYSGQEIDLGKNLTLEILHPPLIPPHFKNSEINSYGLVSRLSYKGISFLFTADIDEEVELYMIADHANLRSTVLKVSHHGSKTASSTEFLTAVGMKAAVISAGENNRFGHPAQETLERLAGQLDQNSIFLTARNGTVEFITDGTGLWVKTEHDN